MQSEHIGDLAAALAKAQAGIVNPKKDRTAGKGGAYSYNYADLASSLECSRKALSDNGLAVTQTFRYEDGHMVLLTTLMHVSGQWKDSEYPIGNYAKPQELGSAITYGRRYSYNAMLGIAPEGEDDDGQKAQEAEAPAKREEAPMSDDDAAILMIAADLAQIRGDLDPGDVLESYSEFKGRDGKRQAFRDPTKVKSEKWKKGVRARMEADLAKEQAKAEPGVQEMAALFEGSVK